MAKQPRTHCRAHGERLGDLHGCRTCCPDCGRNISERWLADHLTGRDYRPSAKNCARNRYAATHFTSPRPYKPLSEHRFVHIATVPAHRTAAA